MARPPRLLLVHPQFETSFWGMQYALPYIHRDAVTAPLGVITVAALTPPTWDVRIIDEQVETLDLDTECDVVGLSAMSVQSSRAFAIADAFRRRGRVVVMGGPLPTLQAERCAPHADVLFMGEAERTWPAFCRDFEVGTYQARYVETQPVDLSTSPTPRYDLLRHTRYSNLPLQTTRGCPFDCEFCDIIVMHGRAVRSKPVGHVLRELEAIRALAGESVFFTDDNLIGDQRHARDLLNSLIRYRRATNYRPVFFSQCSVNVADKPKLLRLMVEAGFSRLFIGIESPRKASLYAAGKRQNTHGDLLERIHRIQQAGIFVWAGMIIGFDQDDESIFEEHARFLDDAGIAIAMVGMLNAPPRTRLHTRLAREGRIDHSTEFADNCQTTNIVPLKMSLEALITGYGALLRHLYAPERYAQRLFANIERMGRSASAAEARGLPPWGHVTGLMRLLWDFTATRDPARRRFFLPNVLRIARRWPQHLDEAIIHLAIWNHFERYLPELSASLEDATTRVRVRSRERAYANALPPALAPASSTVLSR